MPRRTKSNSEPTLAEINERIAEATINTDNRVSQMFYSDCDVQVQSGSLPRATEAAPVDLFGNVTGQQRVEVEVGV